MSIEKKWKYSKKGMQIANIYLFYIRRLLEINPDV